MNGHTRRMIAALALVTALAAGEAWARKEALLDVGAGQVFTDTGSDGKTTFGIEDCQPLGGPALKVVFADGDSAGDRIAKVSNWKPFAALELAAWNPAKEKVTLTLTVRHARSTSYQTRVDMPVPLKPGRNDVKIGIDEMLNVNGTAPDLANVVRWYLACEQGTTPTVFLGSIYLTGPDAAPEPKAAAAVGLLPAGGYRITGRIGDLPVALIVRPLAEPGAPDAAPAAPAAPAAAPHGDPARLERIRSAKMPAIPQPVPFDTPEADAICTALEILPPDNPWNLLVEDWPLHPNSRNMVASVGNDKPMRYNADMGFVLVPPDQKRVDVRLTDYAGESDKGPYPVPDNVPIEGWPADYRRSVKLKDLTLEDVQRDKLNRGGDRHGIVVDPVNRMLYEFYQLRRTDAGWQGLQASIFDLKTNKLRPTGWTSSDAAGLPIFPSIVRYDELKRGRIDHALRVTIRKTRRAFVAPATHYASPHTNEDYPRMGERLRLRKDFDVSPFSPGVRTILIALKRYGMFVADNGIEWAISVAPDERIPVLHEELRKVKGENFEVVVPPK